MYQNAKEPNWLFVAEVTNDGKYVLINTNRDTAAVGLVSIARVPDFSNKNKLHPQLKTVDLIPKWIGSFSYMHNMGTQFYFYTNFRAPRGRVIMIDIKRPGHRNWVEVLAQHPKDVLQYSMYSNRLIIASYLHNAQEVFKVFRVDHAMHKAEYFKEIDLPDIGSLGGVTGSWDSDEMFYSFSSFTDPGSSYRLNTTTFESELIQKTKVSPSIPDSSLFKTDQIWYESKDGTKIPMFIVRKKSLLPDINGKIE